MVGTRFAWTFQFKRSPWFGQCIRVMYWNIVARRLRYKGDTEPPKHYAENQDGECLDKAEYETRSRLMEIHTHAYGRVWKTSFMFKDEHEWYSPTQIRFALEDIIGITYMLNSPVIRPRKTNQIRIAVKRQFGHLYTECCVADHYLKT